jgi:hypothetical protein
MRLKKRLLFIFCFFILIHELKSQDTILNEHYQRIPKRGVYLSFKEFIDNKPSLEKPFTVLPVPTPEKLRKRFNDSLVFGYYINFIDTLFTPKPYYGFSDGKYMYTIFGDGMYYKFEGTGKYSYFTVYSSRDGNPNTNFINYGISGPFDLGMSAGLSVLSKLSYKLRKSFYVYSSEQEFYELKTFDILGRILKKDKDLYKEYGDERTYNIEIYKKYLDKINKRYPLL